MKKMNTQGQKTMKRFLLPLVIAVSAISALTSYGQDVGTRNLILRGNNINAAFTGTLQVPVLTGARAYSLPDASGYLLVSPNATLDPNRILVSNADGLVETLNMNTGKLILGTTGGSYEQLTPTGLGGIVITNAGGELRFDMPPGTADALLRYNAGTSKWVSSVDATLDATGNFLTNGNLTVNGNATLGNTPGTDQIAINGNTAIDVTGQNMNIAGLASTGTFTDDVLMITSGNNVLRRSMADLIGAEGGITYNEANNGRMRLGSTSVSGNPLLENRYLNLNNNDLIFTTNGGATTLAYFEAGSGGANYGVTLNADGANYVTLAGPTRVNTSGTAPTTIGNDGASVTIDADVATINAGPAASAMSLTMQSGQASLQTSGSEQTISVDFNGQLVLLESNDFGSSNTSSVSVYPTRVDILGNTNINGNLNVKKSTTLGDGNGDNLAIDVSNGGVNGTMTIKGLDNGTLTDDVLMIAASPSNVVKRRSLADLIQADNGITYNESSLGYVRLGSTSATGNPLTSNRYINLAGQSLYFTANNGAAIPLSLEGSVNSTNYGVNLAAGTSNDISMTGSVSINTRNSGVVEIISGDNTGTRLDMSASGSLWSYVDAATDAQLNVTLDPAETMISMNAFDGGANETIVEVKSVGLNVRGTTTINTAGNKATTIGNTTGALVMRGATATLNATAGNGNTTIGNTSNTLTLNANLADVNATTLDIDASGAVTVDAASIGLTSTGDVAITVPGAGSGNDLVLNGIDDMTAAVNMLTLDGSNNVRKKSLTSMADEGLQYDATEGEFKLGHSTDGNNAITSSRFIRTGAGGTLTFNTGA
ncbi:MAG: hypothetical protein RL594_1348, partial [Bacteroidota bacterium]